MLNQKNKNKILFLITIIILIIISVFSLNFFQKKELINPNTVEKEIVIDAEETKPSEIELPKISQEIIKEKEIENFVTLNILDRSYQIEVKEGDSVYDVMKNLDSLDNSFSFQYKEYPSLGIFIDEINGIKGKAGAYWIYYVNNKEASVGVSKYILKSGDIITWKQE